MYFRFRNPGIASKIPHVPFLQHNEINHTEKKQKKYLLRRDKEPPTLGTISYELTHKLLFCRTYCIPTFIDPLLFLVIPPQSRSVQHYYPPHDRDTYPELEVCCGFRRYFLPSVARSSKFFEF